MCMVYMLSVYNKLYVYVVYMLSMYNTLYVYSVYVERVQYSVCILCIC